MHARSAPCASLPLAAVAALVALALGTSDSRSQDDSTKIDFGRQIRPILSENCFPCHGPDEKHRKGDLRLDTEEAAFAELESGDGHAIVRGKPEESAVYRALISDRRRERMPPPKSKKTLTNEEIGLIRSWIEQGAPWAEHWSFVAPTRSKVPEAAGSRWPRGEIDRFALAGLRQKGLGPSREADRATLIRRVTFDLTGLPPTLAEVDDFLTDNSDDAWERVVDRLFESPHYGENQARYWLDAARYGDTHGLHLDNFRQIWPYRDWVIRSFNENKRFDEFTIEQLAGDLLPEASIDQKIATGFLRAHVSTSEGGVIPEEYHVHYTNDRVATMSTVWMGVSMGCVTCHEHKFDPFDMKDYYQLFAFFNSLDGPVMDSNKPLPTPVLRAPKRENRSRVAELTATIAKTRTQLAERRSCAEPEFVAWAKQESTKKKDGSPAVTDELAKGLVGHWTFDEPEGDRVSSTVEGPPIGKLRGARRVDGRLGLACAVDAKSFVEIGDSANFEHDQPFSYGAWIRLEPGNRGGAVIARMDDKDAHRGFDLYVSGDRAIAHFIHSWPGNALKVETKGKLTAKEWQHVLVTYDGTSKASGVRIYLDGKSSDLVVRNDNLRGSIQTSVPLQIGRRKPGSPLRGRVDEVRVYDRALASSEVLALSKSTDVERILSLNADERTEADVNAMREHFLGTKDAPYRAIASELSRLEKERGRLETEGAIATMIWRERAEPRPAHILERGAYDKPGERVYRDTPKALPPLPLRESDRRATRLDLAKWLVAPEHPLTARVTVNRLWQQFFGTGIVRTSEDFGSQGALPTHPELLDWLAVEFRESGWNVRHLQKLLVMSATYRQSSSRTAATEKVDPDVTWLSRGPRFRLDAEAIRDNALAVSGLLVRDLGGPSVKPYQPPGIWKAVGYTDSNTATFRRDSGTALYRRSLYTFWKRTAPPPSMVAFDAPSRETCTVRRSRTNTPLAALTLMNDEQYVEASRALATRMLREGGPTDEERATFGFRLAAARLPELDEVGVLLDAYTKTLAHYQANPEGAAKLIDVGDHPTPKDLNACELAAWTMVANVLLNLDETITKE